MKKFLNLIPLLIIIVVVCLGFYINCAKKPNEIKIGISLPLTGPIASYGTNAKRGIDLAIEEINGGGGIGGLKIMPIYEDDQNQPMLGANIMTKFATVDKVPVVIGSAGSTVTLAMTPIANRTKTLLISPISSSPKLTKEGGEYFFRICPSDILQAKILAKWIYEDGNRKVGILYVNNEWGVPIKDAFIQEFSTLGGNIPVIEASNEGDRDFRTQLVKIAAQDPDAIFSPTYPKEGGIILKQIKELGIKVRIYAGDPWSGQELIETAGGSANGVFLTVPAEYKGSEYIKFTNKYKEKYGIEPDINAAFGYDALKAVAMAIEMDGIIGEEIKNAMKNVDFQGVSGHIEFDENGDLSSEAFARKVIKNGKYLFIE